MTHHCIWIGKQTLRMCHGSINPTINAQKHPTRFIDQWMAQNSRNMSYSTKRHPWNVIQRQFQWWKYYGRYLLITAPFILTEHVSIIIWEWKKCPPMLSNLFHFSATGYHFIKWNIKALGLLQVISTYINLLEFLSPSDNLLFGYHSPCHYPVASIFYVPVTSGRWEFYFQAQSQLCINSTTYCHSHLRHTHIFLSKYG